MDEQPGRGDTERSLIDEMRELGQSFAALGKTAFKGGSIRAIVDRAREEIERIAEKK